MFFRSYVFVLETANQEVQEEYIGFLRGLFKGTEPTKYIQLAYLTGILPIKKEKTQSALNNFDEFTMLSAKKLAPYIGFTEDEVRRLAEEVCPNSIETDQGSQIPRFHRELHRRDSSGRN